MFKKFLNIVPALAIMTIPAMASAHVIVNPAQANVGEFVTFSVSVPNERSTPVTNLKLAIPAGLGELTPTVKNGWTITTAKSGDAVTAVTWSGGTIPVGERDDFTFSAQVPAQATELDWKAYQTYGDGTVVHWDQKPAGSDDSTGNAGPYSVTKVTNDLAATAATTTKATGNTTLPLIISLVAIVLSVGSVLFRKK